MMSKLQAIANALSTINDAVFQELCDSFLALRNNNYSVFSRTGSQSKKQKTIKGTPDTFLLLPNGKYIFVEHSTNITEGLSKLIRDLKKCIDEAKTKISLNQISEIILCLNFNLKAEEVQSLKNLLVNTRILLTIYTLDSLAIELNFNHRNLTHVYLGLPLDTGQIVYIDKFIEEYNKASKGISTPLDNTFLHREHELKELKEYILNNDFVILTGAPGIGKTKLALEGISSFLIENLSFGAYCVSYKNHTLLDDLYQYFDSEKDYLLFVDDANRIDAFSQITGFYKATRKGKLKVIITVRDYAFQDIGILCQEFSPKRLDLFKFSDEQIIDIIKAKPFDILNPDYHKEIVRIADGNPKLAIMTALLAKAKQNIYALSDVSDLFENYFSTFIKDNGKFAKEINIKCLGLIAFFYIIPYKNREITSAILENFGIDYSEFIDTIDMLDKLELVEVQFEHVKIPEQNLSTYFFYKAFIKDNMLSFQTLLTKYFYSNNNRFNDCVIPANNTFGSKKVMDKLLPDLQNYWRIIKNEEIQAFKFINTFWYYLQAETLEFVYNLIEELPAIVPLKYEVTYENNAFSHNKDNMIELLGEFFRFPIKLKDVVELAFEYIRKKPEHLAELIHKIREELSFDRNDERFRFERQFILFQVMLKGLNAGDNLYSIAFYELSKTFLSFKFNHVKGGRNHSIYWYDYSIPNIQLIQQFRKEIWDAIDSNFDKHENESLDLLQSYASISPNINKEIMEYDLPFLLDIIEKHLSNESFEHCRYVQDQIRWCKRNSITNPSFSLFSSKFTNSTYETFLKIDWDRFRDKEMFEFEDYHEYEKLKETEIRTSFVFTRLLEIKSFYSMFVFLKKSAKNDWNYNTVLDYIIDENCLKNIKIGCQILLEIIENNNEINYTPYVVFQNQLKLTEQIKYIWSIIQKQEFRSKTNWELSFYYHIDNSLQNYVKAIIDTITKITEPTIITFDRLQKFLLIKPNLFHIILKKIIDKNERDKDKTKIRIWDSFFSFNFNQISENIELIEKAYIQQDEIQNYFDFDGKGFLNILKKDARFLIEYTKSLYLKNQFYISDKHKNLEFIWQVDNIESILIEVFDLVVEKEPYFGILDHFCNSFFRNLQGTHNERAKKFLFDYCKCNDNNSEKMNIVVDIIRNSMRELFEDILLLFLSINQDVQVFSEISWRGNGGTYSGEIIIGDLQAAEWRNILSIIEKSDIGFKLIPIKKYVNEQIEYSLRHGNWERQRRFLDQY